MKEKLRYDRVMAVHQELLNERSEWEQEWRQLSEYLVPGRGIYHTLMKPKKRKLTNPKVINPIAEDALQILTAGMHGRLTSPAMPWFAFAWPDIRYDEMEMLRAHRQFAEKTCHKALHNSAFYSVINSFYIEYGAFGNGCFFLGEDVSPESQSDLHFELLTAGEYSYSMGSDGLPLVFCRTMFYSPRQLIEKFPNTVPEDVKRRTGENMAGADKIDQAVIEYLCWEKYKDKPISRVAYLVSGTAGYHDRTNSEKKPLLHDGFYEFPYMVARWNTIGADTYGIGPGSRALPDIKRLQEMEKGFLMATHKTLDPPLNIPARMRGKVSTLPGGRNYYANPAEVITGFHDIRFDFGGVSQAAERVEQRIQRNFFNDVFITSMRDPNASPLRTGQVDAQEQEKMFRLGPVVERLQSELFAPMIRREYKILERLGRIPELPKEYQELMDNSEVMLISPMAIAQRQVKSQGTDRFMAFVGNAAQFEPEALDNIDVDQAIRQRAEIEGVDLGVLRPQEDVDSIRADRAEAQRKQQEMEQAAMAQAAQAQQTSSDLEAAQARKTQAEAAKTLTETQQAQRTLQ